MVGFTCVSCMFVANTTLMIVFALSGEMMLGMLSLFGAFITAVGVQNALHKTPQRHDD